MIKVLPGENNEFIFKGIIDLDILGQFQDDMVEIIFDKDDLNDNENAYTMSQYKPLRKYINEKFRKNSIGKKRIFSFNYEK